MVTVTGNNVNSEHLRCQFVPYIVNATFVSNTAVRCITPAHVPSLTTIEISNNNQDTTDGVCILMTVRVCFCSLCGFVVCLILINHICVCVHVCVCVCVLLIMCVSVAAVVLTTIDRPTVQSRQHTRYAY